MFKKLTALLLLAVLLCGCTQAAPQPTTAPTEAPPAFALTVEGDVTNDKPVTAKVPDGVGQITGYQWYLDGVAIAGAVNQTLHIPTAAGGKALKVRAYTADAYGESEEITVKDVPNDTRTFAGLYHEAKMLGRCNIYGTTVSSDWSGGGFEIRLKLDEADVTLNYKLSAHQYMVLYVDGVQVQRFNMNKNQESIKLPVPAGEHTVMLVKDSETRTDGFSMDLVSLTFSGQVLERPADKPYYIEVIGDSISCGDGALGKYEYGKSWTAADHSATNSFSWFAAQMLNADYSIVGKGGIGLITQAGPKNMIELYKYINGYRDETVYKPTRIPDIVVVELSGNDKKHGDTAFKQELDKMYDQIRALYGKDAHIIWLGRNEGQYAAAQQIAQERKDTDPNLHAVFFSYGGSGSAAQKTQTSGHPNSAEQKELADALVKYIQDNKLIG